MSKPKDIAPWCAVLVVFIGDDLIQYAFYGATSGELASRIAWQLAFIGGFFLLYHALRFLLVTVFHANRSGPLPWYASPLLWVGVPILAISIAIALLGFEF